MTCRPGSASAGSRIPSFNAARLEGDATKVGFINPVPYRTPPTTSYQRKQRGSEVALEGHFTASRSQAEQDL
jgi:hypothetical protein